MPVGGQDWDDDALAGPATHAADGPPDPPAAGGPATQPAGCRSYPALVPQTQTPGTKFTRVLRWAHNFLKNLTYSWKASMTRVFEGLKGFPSFRHFRIAPFEKDDLLLLM